jgi:hypothetical protein
LFVRDCGATTGFSAQLSLMKDGTALRNEGGNVLILRDGTGWDPRDNPRRPVRVRWRADGTLELEVNDKRDIVLAAESHEDVRIEVIEATAGQITRGWSGRGPRPPAVELR